MLVIETEDDKTLGAESPSPVSALPAADRIVKGLSAG
jgi:hypothetical protein